MSEYNNNDDIDAGGPAGLSTAAFIRGFFTVAVLQVAVVQVAGGMVFGYAVGFVGVYDTLNSENERCGQLTTEAACGSVRFTACQWDASSPSSASLGVGVCGFTGTNCSALIGASACGGASANCAFDYDDHLCKPLLGFDAVKTGIFAGAMVIGGMIGSLAANTAIQKIGQRRTIILAGVVCLIASLLLHVARATNEYGVLVAGRFIVGVSSGLLCVASPMYVEEMAPPGPYARPVGALFQVFVTFGILIAAGVGLAVLPTDFSIVQNNELRLQLFIGVQTLTGVFCVAVGALIPENKNENYNKNKNNSDNLERQGLLSTTTTTGGAGGGRRGGGEEEDSRVPSILRDNNNVNQNNRNTAADDDDNNDNNCNTNSVPLRRLLMPLCLGLVLPFAAQFTGINAIMNYAPNITKAMGLQPMMGNFVVMVWNFVTTVMAIPCSSWLSSRHMYLGGVGVATVSLFVAGIPLYPGLIASDAIRHALAGLGIFAFLLAFGVGIGPAFYVLAQRVFPASFKSKGMSITLVWMFTFNALINILFPIAVTDLSGGPSGNQDLGMAIVFIFFGVCGAASLAVLARWLHPFGTV